MAIDDYLRASCLWPPPGEHLSKFPTTFNLTASDGDSNATMLANLDQVGNPIDSLHATSNSTDAQRSGIGETEFSVMQHVCVPPSHGGMGNIIPNVNSYNSSWAQDVLTPVNPTGGKGTEERASSYEPQQWSLPHVSPFEQYQMGLALCRQAIPRLTQRDQCILGFRTWERNKQHGSINLMPDGPAALHLPLSQACTTGNPVRGPYLACLDFSLA
jgi:hypothetical protein